MAADPNASTKRVAISRANAQMVAVLSVAAFVTVFCLYAATAVWSQNSYQARVVTAKTKAKHQLEDNLDAYSKLASAYNAFNKAPTNVIGGTPTGTGDNDGSNAKIILDALPSTYDFPALTSSIEKIVSKDNLKITNITGVDDQINQQSVTAQSNPTALSIPFTLTVSGTNYDGIKKLVSSLQQSIRPIQVDKITVTGGANNMSVTVDAHTYFQPAKDVNVTKQVVK